MADYISIPEVGRNLDHWAHAPYSVEHALDWIRRHDPSTVNWAIDCLADNAYIGNTGLTDLDFRDRNCEWGIWIGPPSRWNQGFGTEACRLATGFAFRQLGMEKVYLKVYETNPGARRAYEKAGYRLEASLPRDHWWEGGFVTTHLMAAYRDDPAFQPVDRH
jgi:RimJ/RimL family protein N-acetyltransferase